MATWAKMLALRPAGWTCCPTTSLTSSTSPVSGELTSGLDIRSMMHSKCVAGLSMLETDGPYGGETCASTNHTYHTNYGDSVYHQTMTQAALYA